MCETSNMPASRRTLWCSSICEPELSGMSQPPKSTILAPAARCVSLRMVFLVMATPCEIRGAHYRVGLGPPCSQDHNGGPRPSLYAAHLQRRPFARGHFDFLANRKIRPFREPRTVADLDLAASVDDRLYDDHAP